MDLQLRDAYFGGGMSKRGFFCAGGMEVGVSDPVKGGRE